MRFFLSALFFLFLISCIAQDVTMARKNIETLSSPQFHGRGYVEKGDKKGAKFIKSEFKKQNLEAFKRHFQKFSFSVNTFPGAMFLKIDTVTLIPGADYIVHPASASIKGSFSPSWLANPADISIIREFKKFTAGSLLILDVSNKEIKKEVLKMLPANPWGAKAILLLTDEKHTWSVSREQLPIAVLEVKKEKVHDKIQLVELNIAAQFEPKYKTQNVIGYVKGDIVPDSFIIFSAHYDHLGRMGEDVFFPGANDNASGTSMMLDLASHYAKTKSKYSVAFMAFAAEEAGLVGSEFYVNDPLFPLSKIKCLINLDLMGNGEEGITVVNGSVFQEEYNKLVEINNSKHYVPEIKSRGKAANSDHYHFSEKGVKAFFIYTMGGSKAYHDIYDTPSQLPLSHYENIFRLLTDYVNTFN